MLINAFDLFFGLDSLKEVKPLLIIPLFDFHPNLTLFRRLIVFKEEPFEHIPYQKTGMLISVHQVTKKSESQMSLRRQGCTLFQHHADSERELASVNKIAESD